MASFLIFFFVHVQESHLQLWTEFLYDVPPGPQTISPVDSASEYYAPGTHRNQWPPRPSTSTAPSKKRPQTSQYRLKLLENIFQQFNISSRPPSKKRFQPLKLPSERITTCAIPDCCYEEMVPTPLYGGRLLKREDGEHHKESIELTNRKNMPTPIIDCIRGVGFNNPEERLFGLWAAKNKPFFRFAIMVGP